MKQFITINMKDNKLIAEFWGMVLGEDGTMYYDDVENLFPPTPTDKLKFDTEWNWLMPVVEKIEEQHGCDFIASKRRATRTYDANFMDEVNNYVVYVEDCKDRQEATYKAVVEFIKQHNK